MSKRTARVMIGWLVGVFIFSISMWVVSFVGDMAVKESNLPTVNSSNLMKSEDISKSTDGTVFDGTVFIEEGDSSILKEFTSKYNEADGWRPARGLAQLGIPASAGGQVMVKSEKITLEEMQLTYAFPPIRVEKWEYPSLNEGVSIVNGDKEEYESALSVNWVRICLGNAPRLSRIGKPSVPIIPVMLFIPSGKEVANIEVIKGRKIIVKGVYNVEPGQPPVPIIPDPPVNIAVPDPQVYSLDDLYPQQRYEVVGVQKKRGKKIFIMNLMPVEYNPVKGEIAYYETLGVKVITQDISEDNDIKVRADVGSNLDSVVDNPEALSIDPALTTSSLSGSQIEEKYEYVVVTKKSFINASTTPNLQDLLNQKRKAGLTATAVAIEDILANYNGRDDAEKLRNFIKDAYNKWNTDFVLLAGDINIIPMRKLWCEAWPGSSYKDHIPSDLYYQCLDGDYNSNNNDKWGEPNDGPNGKDVDLLAEVYIGRASAETAEELSHWIYKILYYENTPANADYLRNNIFVGEYLGFGGVAQYATAYLEEIRTGSANHGYKTVGFTSCALFNNDTLYESDSYKWDKSVIIGKINSDKYSLINHLGHANYNYVMKFYNSDADGLKNSNPFFAYSQGCIPGNFEVDCIGEHLTTSHRSGAFAVVFNSRYGWGKGYSTDGPSQHLHREFWDGYFGEYKVNLGILNADSHEDNIWALNEECIRWCIYESNLLGDPHTPIRGREEESVITLNSYKIDDSAGNGDGIINPGERIELKITVRNIGLKGANGVKGVISSLDNYISVVDSECNFGDVPGMGASKEASDPVTIMIRKDCPTPRTINISFVTLDVSGRAWTNSFAITVYTSSWISGSVTKDGSPASGVTISYTGPMSGEVITDSNGKYKFVAINGTYSLVASKAGWLPSDALKVTVPGDVNNANFKFTTARVYGVVTVDGTVLSGADVNYKGAFSGTVKTDSSGKYEIVHVYGKQGTLEVQAKKSGYVPSAWTKLTLPPDKEHNILFTTATISGKVVNEKTGEAIKDATVSCSGDYSSKVTTDSNGRYVIKGVFGRTVTLKIQATKTGFFDSDIKQVNVPPSVYDINLSLGFVDIEVTPLSLEVRTVPGGIEKRNITIRNIGSRILDWFIISDSSSSNLGALKEGDVIRSFSLPSDIDYPYGITFDGNVVWVSTYINKILFKVDPVDGRLLGKVNLETVQSPWGIAFDGQYIWVVDYANKNICAVDRVTGKTVRSVKTPSSSSYITGIASYLGDLWVSDCYAKKIYRLDSVTGNIKSTLDLSKLITGSVYTYDLAIYNGAIWLAPYYDTKVYKISFDGQILKTFSSPDQYVIGLDEDFNGNLWLVSYKNRKAFLVDSGEVLWLNINPIQGNVGPDSTQTVELKFDGSKVGIGTNSAVLHVFSNDPDENNVKVYVKFIVLPTSNRAPVAENMYVEVDEDKSVSITLKGSDPDGDPLTYVIVENPSNGTLSGVLPNVSYKPKANWYGMDSFKFKVRDDKGLESNVGVVSIKVRPVNDAPVVNFTASPLSGVRPLKVKFDGSKSYDIEGDQMVFSWDFGDGCAGEGKVVEHVYSVSGNYKVQLKVTDDKGAYSVKSCVIKVVDPNYINGLEYYYYEGVWDKIPDFNKLLVVKRGLVSNFDISKRLRNDYFGFVFEGYIKVSSNGVYNFYTQSDDGSKLWIDGVLVVDNDGLHSSREKGGSIELSIGYHSIKVEFFEKGGSEVLKVMWAGPGISKQLIPNGVLYRIGGILREYWVGVKGTKISDLEADSRYPNSPDGRSYLMSLESVSWDDIFDNDTWADNYGERIRGYIVPEISGNYVFWISGDDECKLYLSIDESVNNKRLICSVPGWTKLREWNRYVDQKSSVIYLEAGKAYYVEVLHKEGGGSDSCSVGWLKPGESGNVPSEVVPGKVLITFK